MWREYKLLNTVIMTGVLELQAFLDDFDEISYRLRVESRKGNRCRMQLANILLS